MNCILLSEHWIVKFQIFKATGDCSILRRHGWNKRIARELGEFEILVVIVLLEDKQEAKWRDF